MICTSCGNTIPNDVTYCPHCGAAQALVSKSSNFSQKVTSSLNISKRLLLIVTGSVFILVLSLILMLWTPTVNKTAESVVSAYVEAIGSCDYERQLDCLSDFTIRYYASTRYALDPYASRNEVLDIMYEKHDKMIDRLISNGIDPYEDTYYYYDLVISECKIIGTFDKSEIDHEKYFISVDEYKAITNTAVVQISFWAIPKNSTATVERDILSDDDNLTELSYRCIEINGKWYVLKLNMY